MVFALPMLGKQELIELPATCRALRPGGSGGDIPASRHGPLFQALWELGGAFRRFF
jgi:hypothetical protein